MPAVSRKLIVNEFIEAIQQSGGSAYCSENVDKNPSKFVVSYLGNTCSLWIYIWTITHGGRVSLPDEYRIQMTSVSSPLQKNPSGLTVHLFEDNVALERLVLISGGCRFKLYNVFCEILRFTIVFPITKEDVDRAIIQVRDYTNRSISDDTFKLLFEVYQKPFMFWDELYEYRRLIDDRKILYYNCEPSYWLVHPLIEEMDGFKRLIESVQ